MVAKLLNYLMSVEGVAETFRRALAEKKPISHVNLGDGEIMFLAHPQIPGFETLQQPSGIDPYLKYIADPAIRNEVLDGVLHADIIGMPAWLYTGNWPAAEYFLEYYSIPTQRICDSYMGRLLHSAGALYEFLKNQRVYLVGNHILNLVPLLEEHQIEVAGHTTVDYFEDIPRVKDCLSKADFDMALLSAGIPTLILSPWICRTLNRCALDFGSAIHHL
ncbi:MAG TPA: hypothetical protein DDW50_03445 [Firmicutes bacterium]|jgi:hypothetical protein|nr:hypothetical protein [Bacillota bacterium]